MAAIGVISVQILPNQPLSGEAEIGAAKMIAFEIPTSFGATTLTFQGKSSSTGLESVNNPAEVWRDIYDDAGTEFSITVAPNRMVSIGTAAKVSVLRPFRYIRIRCGTAAAPVNINPGAVVKIITKQD